MAKMIAVLVGLIGAAIFAVPAFAEGTGFVEVCKAAGSPAVTGSFSFAVNDAAPISIGVGECSAPIAVPAGTATVAETPTTDAAGFSDADFTAVSDIRTTAPGALNADLVRASLSGRTATVAVMAGGVASTTIVTFTNVLVQGYVEICKQQVAGAGLDGQSFAFTVQGGMGFQQTATVPVNGCSNPILAPAGHVDITEADAATFVTSISALPTNDRILWSSLATGTASIAVPAAAPDDVSNESIVTFTNNTSQLKICKVAGSPELLGSTYMFSVNGGAPIPVIAGDGTTHCTLVPTLLTPTRFRTGSTVSITEAPTPGEALASISLSDGRTFAASGSDFIGNTATFTIGSGETVATFTNILAAPGLLKICKAGPAGSSGTFTIAGPRGTAPGTAQGADTVTVSAGSCSLPVAYPYAGIQTITEAPQAGSVVSAIGVQPTDAFRIASPANTAAGTVGVFIAPGETVVTFTNAAAAPTAGTGGAPAPAGGAPAPAGGTPASAPAPVAASGSAPSASGGASGSAASAPAPATAVAAAVHATTAAPAAVSKPKAAQTATVASVQVRVSGAGRYVVVRVAGTAKQVRIRLTLRNAHGKTLKVVYRTVKTNRAVRVPNLKLAPSVRSVRVAIAV
jgi:hypothetical protein